MKVAEYFRVSKRIQQAQIDVCGEFINFPYENSNDFLPDFERILLKYAKLRGCAGDGAVSKRQNKLQESINLGDERRWQRLNWDAVQDVSYSTASIRKHYIHGYRINVLAGTLRYIADRKINAHTYQNNISFADVANEFNRLVQENNVPQYGWNGAESFLYLLSLVVEDRKRIYDAVQHNLQPALADAQVERIKAQSLEAENSVRRNMTFQGITGMKELANEQHMEFIQERTRLQNEIKTLKSRLQTQVDRRRVIEQRLVALTQEKAQLEKELTQDLKAKDKEIKGLEKVKGQLMSQIDKAGGTSGIASIQALEQTIERYRNEMKELAQENANVLAREVEEKELLQKQNHNLVVYANRLLTVIKNLLQVFGVRNHWVKEKLQDEPFQLRADGKSMQGTSSALIYEVSAELLNSAVPSLKANGHVTIANQATLASEEFKAFVDKRKQAQAAKQQRLSSSPNALLGARAGRSKDALPAQQTGNTLTHHK